MGKESLSVPSRNLLLVKEGNMMDLQENDIVQLHPEKTINKIFAGCLMIVTEPKSWGAVGYVQALGENRGQSGSQVYYRAKFEEMTLVGILPK